MGSGAQWTAALCCVGGGGGPAATERRCRRTVRQCSAADAKGAHAALGPRGTALPLADQQHSSPGPWAEQRQSRPMPPPPPLATHTTAYTRRPPPGRTASAFMATPPPSVPEDGGLGRWRRRRHSEARHVRCPRRALWGHRSAGLWRRCAGEGRRQNCPRPFEQVVGQSKIGFRTGARVIEFSLGLHSDAINGLASEARLHIEGVAGAGRRTLCRQERCGGRTVSLVLCEGSACLRDTT